MKDKIDKLESDYARGSSIVRRSRAADGQCPGGRRAPPDFRFSRPASRSKEQIDRLEAIEKVRQPSNPASASRRGETHCGRDLRRSPCEGTQDTPHRSRPQANSSISFLDHGTIDRSMYDAIADPACELARIDPAGRDASEPVGRIDDRHSPSSRRDCRESSTRTSDRGQDRRAGT